MLDIFLGFLENKCTSAVIQPEQRRKSKMMADVANMDLENKRFIDISREIEV